MGWNDTWVNPVNRGTFCGNSYNEFFPNTNGAHPRRINGSSKPKADHREQPADQKQQQKTEPPSHHLCRNQESKQDCGQGRYSGEE